jgi:ubiquitin C-terminal hydrolase
MVDISSTNGSRALSYSFRRKMPLSSLHSGNFPCRIMIECRNTNGYWPTTEICSEPRPKWMNNLLDSTLRKHKVGDRVIARSPEGLWYPGTVMAVESNNQGGSSEDRYMYLVRFERQNGATATALTTWDCKVYNAYVNIVPNMTWATPLLIESHLLLPIAQLSTPRTDGSRNSKPLQQQNAAGGDHLPPIRKNSPRGSSTNDFSVEMGNVLGSKNSNKLSSVSPGTTNEQPSSSGSSEEVDGLMVLRRYNLSKALKLIPFIDSCCYLEHEIQSNLNSKSNTNRIGSASSVVSSASRGNAVRVGATTASSDNADGNTLQPINNKDSNNSVSISVVEKKKPADPVCLTIQDTNGVLGLWNLGNTCYMSAALHCVSHTPFLRMYFLSGRFRRDLNRSNIFGTGGKLTEEFAALLTLLWTTGGGDKVVSVNASSPIGNTAGTNNSVSITNGSKKVGGNTTNGAQPNSTTGGGQNNAKYVTPRTFKRVLDKTKSQFEGNHQQDSQEFLSALLDALHEDLNKYDKKREELSELQRNNAAAAANDAAVPGATNNNTKYVDTDNLRIGLGSSQGSAYSNADSISTANKVSVGEFSPKTTQPDFSDSGPIELLDVIETAGGDSKGKGESKNVTAMGESAWSKHIARNKSVIVDMFQGQQCTEVKCKECGYSSVTFDPFMSISLPLPKQHEITIVVTFLRKLPRLRAMVSTIMDELDLETDLPLKFKTIAKNFVLSFRKCRSQMRMCISLPRLAEVSALKQSICKVLHERAARLNDPALLNITPEYLLLTDCVQYTQYLLDYSRFLDDRFVQAQLI